jgi:hypothetical protein
MAWSVALDAMSLISVLLAEANIGIVFTHAMSTPIVNQPSSFIVKKFNPLAF